MSRRIPLPSTLTIARSLWRSPRLRPGGRAVASSKTILVPSGEKLWVRASRRPLAASSARWSVPSASMSEMPMSNTPGCPLTAFHCE